MPRLWVAILPALLQFTSEGEGWVDSKTAAVPTLRAGIVSGKGPLRALPGPTDALSSAAGLWLRPTAVRCCELAPASCRPAAPAAVSLPALQTLRVAERAGPAPVHDLWGRTLGLERPRTACA